MLRYQWTTHLCQAASGKHSAALSASVPIPKFLFNFCVDCESSAAEALDRSQDVVGGFGPLERSGVRIASVDEGVDGRLQLCDRLMRSSLDLLLGEEREEPLDLIDP